MDEPCAAGKRGARSSSSLLSPCRSGACSCLRLPSPSLPPARGLAAVMVLERPVALCLPTG